MKRTVLVSLLIALLAGGAAHAQVAVPELAPAAPRYLAPNLKGFNSASLTVDNPAAIQWSDATRAAYGIIKLAREVPGSVTPKDDFSGYFVGYRGVMDSWALGLEQVSVDQDTNGVFNETTQSAHASLKALDMLSVGAGLDRDNTDFGGFSENLRGLTFGASVNLDKAFYAGYVTGTEDLTDSNGLGVTRDFTGYGFAIHTERGTRWHLAYDRLEKDDFGTIFARGFDATTYTVQVGIGDFVGGVQSVTIEPLRSNQERTATIVDLGWVPKRKIFVAVRATHSENSAAGAVVEKDDTTALIVGYGF